ncbi:DUF4962 domain-containing protein [Tamlana fucoidanivorans]|uniref:DUF4962 domain-containing protein n=1 Tax=Allotamlana fucoidanivorans TaxID=2583814 RepID=UPI0013051D46|nr:DUF4962 domain-containing protein [Tamlana fucoidanivorans]
MPGEIRLTAEAVHPLWRANAFPDNIKSDINPPAYFWPSKRRGFTEPLINYEFQLSSDSMFYSIHENVKGHNPSSYVSKKPLKKGKWYWRYREEGKAWNGNFSFLITDSSRLDSRPSSDVLVRNVKSEVKRPRVVIRQERLETVRDTFKANGITEALLKESEEYFGVILPEKEWGGKFYKNAKRVFKPKKFPDGHIKSKITAPIWMNAIKSLCVSYLLTNDAKYANEALRWGMRVTEFDILTNNNLTYDGNPVPDGFDFAMYLDAITYLYDCLYNYMSDSQKESIRENLSKRLEIYYQYYTNRLENRCIDNHTWQISLGAFVRGAITVVGDIPEADKYLSYAYDIWTAIDPEQSHTDGGWFGGGYVAVNIDVWTEVPCYFNTYTGHNFYDYPFYRNHPLYFLYRQPPGSVEDGFSGDGYGSNSKTIGDKLGLWLNILDAELNSPVAGWLANSNKGKLNKPEKFKTFAWTRQTEGKPLKNSRIVDSLGKMPQSRAFKDIGIVNMHSDLLNPKNDLHVALRSSPFGTFGHNLASHNAFNVIYKGDYLFAPFGHRHGGAKNNATTYKHTRGHNSILINGKGQPYSPEAYGWIPRFLDGKTISYACGDASNAYDAEPFERETQLFSRAKLKVEEHISRGLLERFRRHVVFIRPSIILVYDELEADTPVQWDWVLHSRKDLKKRESSLEVKNVNARVDFKSSSPMEISINDKPLFPAINVDGRAGAKPGTPYPQIGNHAFVSSSEKVEKIRIMSIIQVGDVKPIKTLSKDEFLIGDWTITSELNPNKMANMKVFNTDNTVNFTLKSNDGESVLKEVLQGKLVESKIVDQLPYHAQGLKHDSNIKQ